MKSTKKINYICDAKFFTKQKLQPKTEFINLEFKKMLDIVDGIDGEPFKRWEESKQKERNFDEIFA